MKQRKWCIIPCWSMERNDSNRCMSSALTLETLRFTCAKMFKYIPHDKYIDTYDKYSEKNKVSKFCMILFNLSHLFSKRVSSS